MSDYFAVSHYSLPVNPVEKLVAFNFCLVSAILSNSVTQIEFIARSSDNWKHHCNSFYLVL